MIGCVLIVFDQRGTNGQTDSHIQFAGAMRFILRCAYVVLPLSLC